MRIRNVKIEVDDFRLDGVLYEPAGSGRFPALIFAHGFASCRREFGDTPERLAQAGFVTLAFDFRGHGSSSGLSSLVTAESHLADIQAAYKYLLEAPTIDPNAVGVCAHSMGSAAALALARVDRSVGSLVLLAPPSRPRYALSDRMYLAYATAFSLTRPVRHVFGRQVFLPYPYREEDLCVDAACQERAAKERLLMDWVSIDNFPYLAHGVDNVSAARRVTIPTAVLVGEQDKVIGTAQSREVYNALAGPKGWRSFPETGHSLLLDQQREGVCGAIHDWFIKTLK